MIPGVVKMPLLSGAGPVTGSRKCANRPLMTRNPPVTIEPRDRVMIGQTITHGDSCGCRMTSPSAASWCPADGSSKRAWPKNVISTIRVM